MSRRAATPAASDIDVDLDAALYTSRALRLFLFDLEGEGLNSDARRAAAELAFAIETKLEEVRESIDIVERYRRAGDQPPVKVGRA